MLVSLLPALCGSQPQDDMGQINMLFSTLGTPTESEWPGVSELPVMQKKNHTFQSCAHAFPSSPLFLPWLSSPAD